jgi:hypothetical protein
MVNRELQDIQAAAFYEVKEDYYASIEDRFAKAWAENAGIDDAAFNRRQADAGNAGARGADAPDVGGQSRADGQDELERATARSFDARLVGLDDPTSPQSRAVIDGMIHDLEMIAVLDADVTFRISDDGPEQSIADALNDLRAKQSEIDALKACMLPKGNG